IPFSFHPSGPPRPLHSFPTRRSSDLFALMPACFALVWLVLPLRSWRWTIALAAAFGLLALVFHLAGLSTPENFCKLFGVTAVGRSEEHTSELQSRFDLVCRLLLEKKK